MRFLLALHFLGPVSMMNSKCEYQSLWMIENPFTQLPFDPGESGPDSGGILRHFYIHGCHSATPCQLKVNQTITATAHLTMPTATEVFNYRVGVLVEHGFIIPATNVTSLCDQAEPQCPFEEGDEVVAHLNFTIPYSCVKEIYWIFQLDAQQHIVGVQSKVSIVH